MQWFANQMKSEQMVRPTHEHLQTPPHALFNYGNKTIHEVRCYSTFGIRSCATSRATLGAGRLHFSEQRMRCERGGCTKDSNPRPSIIMQLRSIQPRDYRKALSGIVHLRTSPDIIQLSLGYLHLPLLHGRIRARAVDRVPQPNNAVDPFFVGIGLLDSLSRLFQAPRK